MNREADRTNAAPQAGMLTKCNNSAQRWRPSLEYAGGLVVLCLNGEQGELLQSSTEQRSIVLITFIS